MKTFIQLCLIAILICQTQTVATTIAACNTNSAVDIDVAQVITSEAGDTFATLQTCLAKFTAPTTATSIDINLTGTTTGLAATTGLTLAPFTALTGLTINIAGCTLDGTVIGEIVDIVIAAKTTASGLITISATLKTSGDSNTFNAATYTAMDALVVLSGVTTTTVVFKPYGAFSCADLTAADSDANACKTAAITDLSADCAAATPAETVTIVDATQTSFTNLNTCLNLLTSVTELTIDLNNSTLSDPSAGLVVGSLNTSITTLTINITNCTLNGAAIGSFIDAIVTLEGNASSLGSITSSFIAATDNNTADNATFTALDSLMALTLATNAVVFKPFGTNSCIDLVTGDANADACRIATDMDLSACDSKLALAHTVSITDATKSTLVDLNTCVNLLTSVTNLTINISGSPITDASAGLVFGSLNTSIITFNLDVTDCDLNATAILAVINAISTFVGSNVSLVNADIKLQAGASQNIVDFTAVKAGYKLALLFTTSGSVQFYDGSSTCSFAHDTTAVQALTVCSNYPQTLDYDIVKNGSYAGSAATTFQNCSGASLVFTLSTPAAFTNLYADTAPTYSSPTDTWTYDSSPTVANTLTVDLSTATVGSKTVDVASVNGSNTYNGKQYTFDVEACSAKATISMVGSEGDSDYELCEDVTFSAPVTQLVDSAATVVSTTWSMANGLGATQLSKGALTAQSTLADFKIAKDTFISTDSKGPYTVSVVVAVSSSETVVSQPMTFTFIACDTTDHQDTGNKPVTESSSILQVSVALLALFILI